MHKFSVSFTYFLIYFNTSVIEKAVIAAADPAIPRSAGVQNANEALSIGL
jgi:hypothetical protein